MKMTTRILFLVFTVVVAGLSSVVRAQKPGGPACTCGPGYDYGCDQTRCDQSGATCQQGHCNQDGLESPSCAGGACSQNNATNASCDGGNCCPPGPGATCGPTTEDNCMGADTRVFSCTMNEYSAVRELSVGDSIRVVSADSAESQCSDVYYVFQHKAKSTSFVIQVTGQDDSIVMSPSHLLYVGTSFESRRAVLAKHLRIGDALVSSSSSSSSHPVVVLSIQTKKSNLVNILTLDSPAIELEHGVIISAYSFHETVYSAVFWPLAMSYKYLGAAAFKDYILPSQAFLERLHQQTNEIAQMAAAVFLSLPVTSSFG